MEMLQLDTIWVLHTERCALGEQMTANFFFPVEKAAICSHSLQHRKS